MHISEQYYALLVIFFRTAYSAKILCIASVPTYSHNVFFRPIWRALADRGHELTVLTTNPMDNPYPSIKEIDLNFVYERTAYSAKILCIASVPTYSHNVFFRPIWRALADRGHELTVLTTNPMDNPYPSIKEIDLNFVYERKIAASNLTWSVYNWPTILNTFEKYYREVSVMELNHPEVQEILHNETEHFDLVIAEMHITAMFGFAHRFRCPLIGISSGHIPTSYHALLGNPTHPIMYPNIFVPNIEKSFSKKLGLCSVQLLALMRYTRPNLDNLDVYFGPNTPSVEDMIKNINLVLLNIHPLFNYRPLGPKFVSIGGGIHIQAPKPLPKALQELMDNSTQGLVYFSLGTNIRVSQFPPNLINTSIEAFRELPYQIIWKYAKPIPNLPENVKLFKWLPQQDLLRHKNVKVFITQGGIHSLEEAICFEIPIIGIPLMSDQTKNIHDFVTLKGIGVSLDKHTMTKEDLKEAIVEVATNPKYKNKVSRISRVLKDQPMTGLEKAVWYIEYVIRNKDIKDLYRNPNLDIPWYEYIFLDILAVLIILIVFIVIIVYLVLKIIWRIIRNLESALAKMKVE